MCSKGRACLFSSSFCFFCAVRFLLCGVFVGSAALRARSGGSACPLGGRGVFWRNLPPCSPGSPASWAAFPFVLDAACSVRVLCERLWEMTVVCCKWSCIMCREFVTRSSETCSALDSPRAKPSLRSRLIPSKHRSSLASIEWFPAIGRDWKRCCGS